MVARRFGGSRVRAAPRNRRGIGGPSSWHENSALEYRECREPHFIYPWHRILVPLDASLGCTGELCSVREIGPAIAESVHDFFQSEGGGGGGGGGRSAGDVEGNAATPATQRWRSSRPRRKAPPKASMGGPAARPAIDRLTGTLMSTQREEIEEPSKSSAAARPAELSRKTSSSSPRKTPGARLAKAKRTGGGGATEDQFIKRVGVRATLAVRGVVATTYPRRSAARA